MGFSKWFIKNGPGGTGWMTKFWLKQFLKLPNDFDEKDKLFFFINLFQKTQIGSKNLIRITNPITLLDFSDNCFATLFFCLMCDTTGFEKNISVSNKTFNDAIFVIYEIVNDLAPETIIFSPEYFKFKCMSYKPELYNPFF